MSSLPSDSPGDSSRDSPSDPSVPLYSRVGFDYVEALRALLQRMTYEEVAHSLGYRSTGPLGAIVKRGHVPSHQHGEALWALYVQMFGRKPPMTAVQAAGNCHSDAPNGTATPHAK